MARDFQPITERSKTKPKQTQITCGTQNENRSIEGHFYLQRNMKPQTYTVHINLAANLHSFQMGLNRYRQKFLKAGDTIKFGT